MRQLTFVQPNVVEWREVADPMLQGDGEALVRPVVVANCDLDGLIITGRFPVPGPFALGHEFIAEVVDIGDAVSTVMPGDTVIVPFQVSCGGCDRCEAGLTGSCRTVRRGSAYGLGPLGRGEWGGALSDIVRVPYADAMLVPLGTADPLALASASDNLPDAYRTVAGPLHEHPGGTVLIVAGGYGSIPLYAAAIACALGAGRVDYVDISQPRLALAQRLGAQPLEGREAVGRSRYPIVVDCAATDPTGLAFCLRHVEPGGICTSIGIYLEDVALPMLEMYTTGVTFRTGRVDARPVIPEIVGLVASDRLRPQLVTSTVVGWEDAPAAVLDLPTKLVISRV